MSEKMLFTKDVAERLEISEVTLNLWYKFKRENPDNEYAKILPEVKRVGCHNKRYWIESDIPLLFKFKADKPHGVKGVMGSVTQRYVKKGQNDD